MTFAKAEATAKRLGVKIPDHLRVAPATNETTVTRSDDPAPAVNRTLAIDQFRAALAHLNPQKGVTRSLGCTMREKTKMSDIVKKTEQLPADFGANLMKGIEQTRSTLSTGGGGKPFMRLSRAGEFIYGPQNVEVQPGSHWAVNLAGLEHGWVCWGDGELLGQTMCSVQLPLPARPMPIEGYPFEGQWGMTLACVKGDDKGLETIYENNSLRVPQGVRPAKAVGHPLPVERHRPAVLLARCLSWKPATTPTRSTARSSSRSSRSWAGPMPRGRCRPPSRARSPRSSRNRPRKLQRSPLMSPRPRPVLDSAAARPRADGLCRRPHGAACFM